MLVRLKTAFFAEGVLYRIGDREIPERLRGKLPKGTEILAQREVEPDEQEMKDRIEASRERMQHDMMRASADAAASMAEKAEKFRQELEAEAKTAKKGK